MANASHADSRDAAVFHRRRYCEICGKRFFLTGRHHCRHCGISVCSAHFDRPKCTSCLREAQQPWSGEQVTDTKEEPPPPRGIEDIEITRDVYATAFILANNATPDMYSFAPWRNSDMLLIWFYLLFIGFSQSFVLASLTVFHPPAVDSELVFVDCANLTLETTQLLANPLAQLQVGSCNVAGIDEVCKEIIARCFDLDIAFEADVSGQHVQYRKFEHEVPYYQNVFGNRSSYILLLQFVCCVWVTVQVYFVDVKNVTTLLQFRDFNRWMLPLKNEQLKRNSWVLFIPLLQFGLGTAVVAVSCCVICGYTKAFDIVLNSLAFTFISQVAEIFNEPLLRYYSQRSIEGLDESYGPDPIYYLVVEYSDRNVNEEGAWCDGWYIKQDDQVAGLLTDFNFRHCPEDYDTPSAVLIRWMRFIFFATPVVATLLCWGLFSRHQ